MPTNSPDPTNARKLAAESAVSNPLDSALPNLSSPEGAVGVAPKHAASDARLVGELIDAAPSLPADRREAVVAMLTGLMADRERLEDYQGSLMSLLKGTELEGAEPTESLAVDERDDRIAAEGFSWLSDQELVAVAVSPKGLKAIYELLEDPDMEVGEWHVDAMIGTHVDRPEVKELADRARRRVAHLMRNDASDRELAGELLQAAPAIPEGRREVVVELLTGLVAEGTRLQGYEASLRGLRGAIAAPEAEPHPSDSGAIEAVHGRILAQGFAVLPDAELTALALSPRAVAALSERLKAPEAEIGDWFPTAVIAAHRDLPEVKEMAQRMRERVARLISERESGA